MACCLLVANVINIGADLAGMAATTALLSGIHAYYFTPVYAGLMVLLMSRSSYHRIATIFKGWRRFYLHM
jgi:hypothetical protein